MKKIFYLFSILLIGFSASAQLSGTYTIYGTTPNYASLQEACDSLMSQGQSGPVIFNIRDGMYTESVTLNTVVGNSAVNTITFKSESNDSALVKIASNTISTFTFTDVDYIRFEQISISFTGSSGNTVDAQSTDILFDFVKVMHLPINNGWAINIYRDAGVDNVSFINSTLTSSDKGIYIASDITDVTNTAVTNSTITANGTGFQIYAEKSLTNLTVDNSAIHSNTNDGLYIEGYYNKIDSVTITNSEFTSGTGIGSGSNAFYAYSDFITQNVNIDNCSFNSTNSTAVELEGYYTKLENVSIKNSNFIGKREGLYLYSDVITSNITLDNDTFITNPTVNTSTWANAAYIEGYGQLQHVNVSNSYFQSPQPSYGYHGLELYSGTGKINNATVKNSDFNGREGISFYAEIGGTNWTIDSNTVNSSHTALDFEPYYGLGSNINISNNIINSINSNGIYVYSDAKLAAIVINANTINAGSYGIDIEGYYGGMDNIVVKNNIDTSSSTGIYIYSDAKTTNVEILNNSLFTDDYGINLEGYYGGVDDIVIDSNYLETTGNGIYMYTDAALKNVDITNNKIITDDDGMYLQGYYGGMENFVIDNNIDTAGGYGIYMYTDAYLKNVVMTGNTIDADNDGFYAEGYNSGMANFNFTRNTINSYNNQGIYLYTYANMFNISITDSNYVTADDQALYVEADNGGLDSLTIDRSYFYSKIDEGAYIYIDYAALKNVRITNSIFIGDTVNQGEEGLYLESDDSDMENLVIINNTVYSGGEGIYIEADYGNAANATVSYNSIWSNYEGIEFDGVGNNTNIIGNTINPFSVTSSPNAYNDYGIYTYGYDGPSYGITIANNHIADAEEYGIYSEYSNDVLIENNYIRYTGTGSQYGIYTDYIGGTMSKINGNQLLSNSGYEGVVMYNSAFNRATPAIISNNFISGYDYSIDIEDIDNIKVYYNSMSSPDNEQMVYITNATNVAILNNIFKVYGTSDGEIFYGNTSNANIVINNNVYDFDTALVNMSSDAYFGTNNALVDFQTATSQDANSFEADPMFINDTTDLHINCTNSALVAALNIESVTNDIDGYVRNTTTSTIGAHEITPVSANLLDNSIVFCTSATITPNVVGALYAWSSGGVTTRSITVISPGVYKLTLTDFCGNVYVDSIIATLDLPVAGFTVTANGNNVLFNNTSTNATDYVWDFGDGTTSTDANPQHTYTDGDDTYTVQLISSNTCTSDNFTSVVSTVNIVESLETRGLNIYPNPTTDNITLDFGFLVGETVTIYLIDIQGKVLSSDKITNQLGAYKKSLNLSNLTDGIYFLRIDTNDESLTKKVIKN